MPVIPQAGLALPQQPTVRFDPIGTLGELARVKTEQIKQRAAEQEMADREAQRKLQQQMQAELAQAGDDPNRILSVLNRYDPKLASEVSAKWQEGQKAALEAEGKAIANENARMDMGGRLLRAFDGLDPNSPEAAAMWETVYPSLARIAGQELAGALPEQYRPDILPALQNMLAEGTAYNTMREESRKAWERGDPFRAVAMRLAAAQTPEQRDEVIQQARFMGVPSADLSVLTQADPSRLAEMAISPEKRADLASAEAGRAVTMRGQDISAATARRGQDISAATARRGQDLSAATAKETGGAKLSATAIEKIAGVDSSLSMLDDIERLLPSMLSSIGPIQGRLTSVQLKTGVGVTEELAEFAAQITGLKNAVIKAITGAQMSEPEAKRIMGQIPDLDNPDAVFRARMATTRRNLETLKRRTIELSGGSMPEADSDPLGIRKGGG